MTDRKKIPMYLVDAFTDEQFKGNPAAVCVLNQPLEDEVMQGIAAEMNLSETAFLLPEGEKPIKESITFSLRWFTPKVEVPLCGHATLATAFVLFSEIGLATKEINFETKSGRLVAKLENEMILLNFPSHEPVPIDPPSELLEAMGISEFKNVVFAKNAKKLLVHLKDEDSVKNLKPNFGRMTGVGTNEDIIGIITTSEGSPPYDFISRFFAPWVGVDEDPVTGSAHTVLTPYWSKILSKKKMWAYQASQRGGKLMVCLCPDNRVDLLGNAVMAGKGELFV
ncbi:MAG: PhzF family phenazine biosynthesis protein [Methanomassiliicoccales archaeon]|nr:MAG: PhzF family phenazine biosynthesis protein [Methanomassiliicoccales archaeon]